MNNLTRTIWFRLIAIILVNAFFCMDISWAAGGNLKGLTTHLAPPTQIDKQQTKIFFTNPNDVLWIPDQDEGEYLDSVWRHPNRKPAPSKMSGKQSKSVPKNIIRAEESYRTGRIHLNQHDYDLAINAFEKALIWRPGRWPYWYHLGHAYWRKSEAETNIEKKIFLLQKAVDCFDEVLEIKPNSAQTKIDLQKAQRKLEELVNEPNALNVRFSGNAYSFMLFPVIVVIGLTLYNLPLIYFGIFSFAVSVSARLILDNSWDSDSQPIQFLFAIRDFIENIAIIIKEYIEFQILDIAGRYQILQWLTTRADVMAFFFCAVLPVILTSASVVIMGRQRITSGNEEQFNLSALALANVARFSPPDEKTDYEEIYQKLLLEGVNNIMSQISVAHDIDQAVEEIINRINILREQTIQFLIRTQTKIEEDDLESALDLAIEELINAIEQEATEIKFDETYGKEHPVARIPTARERPDRDQGLFDRNRRGRPEGRIPVQEKLTELQVVDQDPTRNIVPYLLGQPNKAAALRTLIRHYSLDSGGMFISRQTIKAIIISHGAYRLLTELRNELERDELEITDTEIHEAAKSYYWTLAKDENIEVVLQELSNLTNDTAFIRQSRIDVDTLAQDILNDVNAEVLLELSKSQIEEPAHSWVTEACNTRFSGHLLIDSESAVAALRGWSEELEQGKDISEEVIDIAIDILLKDAHGISLIIELLLESNIHSKIKQRLMQKLNQQIEKTIPEQRTVLEQARISAFEEIFLREKADILERFGRQIDEGLGEEIITFMMRGFSACLLPQPLADKLDLFNNEAITKGVTVGLNRAAEVIKKSCEQSIDVYSSPSDISELYYVFIQCPVVVDPQLKDRMQLKIIALVNEIGNIDIWLDIYQGQEQWNVTINEAFINKAFALIEALDDMKKVADLYRQPGLSAKIYKKLEEKKQDFPRYKFPVLQQTEENMEILGVALELAKDAVQNITVQQQPQIQSSLGQIEEHLKEGDMGLSDAFNILLWIRGYRTISQGELYNLAQEFDNLIKERIEVYQSYLPILETVVNKIEEEIRAAEREYVIISREAYDDRLSCRQTIETKTAELVEVLHDKKTILEMLHALSYRDYPESTLQRIGSQLLNAQTALANARSAVSLEQRGISEQQRAEQRERQQAAASTQAQKEAARKRGVVLEFIESGNEELWLEVKNMLTDIIAVKERRIFIADSELMGIAAQEPQMTRVLRIIFSFYQTSDDAKKLVSQELSQIIRADRGFLEAIIQYPAQEADETDLAAREKLLRNLASSRSTEPAFTELIEDETLNPSLEAVLLDTMAVITDDIPTPLLRTLLENRKQGLLDVMHNEQKRKQFLAGLGRNRLQDSDIFSQVAQILLDSEVYAQDGASFLAILDIPNSQLRQRVCYTLLMENPVLLADGLLAADEQGLNDLVQIFSELNRPKTFPDGEEFDFNWFYTNILSGYLPAMVALLTPEGILPDAYSNVEEFLKNLFTRAPHTQITLYLTIIPGLLHTYNIIFNENSLDKIPVFLKRLLPDPSSMRSIRDENHRTIAAYARLIIDRAKNIFELILINVDNWKTLDEEILLERLHSISRITRVTAQYCLTLLWTERLKTSEISPETLAANLNNTDGVAKEHIREALIDIADSDLPGAERLTELLFNITTEAYAQDDQTEKIKEAIALRYLYDKASLTRQEEILALAEGYPEIRKVLDTDRGDLVDLLECRNRLAQVLGVRNEDIPSFTIDQFFIKPTLNFWQGIITDTTDWLYWLKQGNSFIQFDIDVLLENSAAYEDFRSAVRQDLNNILASEREGFAQVIYFLLHLYLAEIKGCKEKRAKELLEEIWAQADEDKQEIIAAVMLQFFEGREAFLPELKTAELPEEVIIGLAEFTNSLVLYLTGVENRRYRLLTILIEILFQEIVDRSEIEMFTELPPDHYNIGLYFRTLFAQGASLERMGLVLIEASFNNFTPLNKMRKRCAIEILGNLVLQGTDDGRLGNERIKLREKLEILFEIDEIYQNLATQREAQLIRKLRESRDENTRRTALYQLANLWQDKLEEDKDYFEEIIKKIAGARKQEMRMYYLEIVMYFASSTLSVNREALQYLIREYLQDKEDRVIKADTIENSLRSVSMILVESTADIRPLIEGSLTREDMFEIFAEQVNGQKNSKELFVEFQRMLSQSIDWPFDDPIKVSIALIPTEQPTAEDKQPSVVRPADDRLQTDISNLLEHIIASRKELTALKGREQEITREIQNLQRRSEPRSSRRQRQRQRQRSPAPSNTERINSLNEELDRVQAEIQSLTETEEGDWEKLDSHLKNELRHVLVFFINKMRVHIQDNIEEIDMVIAVLAEILQRLNISPEDEELHDALFAVIVYTFIAGGDVSKIILIYIEKEISYLINTGLNLKANLASFVGLAAFAYHREDHELFDSLWGVLKEYVVLQDFSNVTNVLELALEQNTETAMEILYRMLTEIDNFLYKCLTVSRRDKDGNIEFTVDGVFLADYYLRLVIYLTFFHSDETLYERLVLLRPFSSILEETINETINLDTKEVILLPEFINIKRFFLHTYRPGINLEVSMMDALKQGINNFSPENALQQALELEFLASFLSREDIGLLKDERQEIIQKVNEIVQTVRKDDVGSYEFKIDSTPIERINIEIIARIYSSIQNPGQHPLTKAVMDDTLKGLVYLSQADARHVLFKVIAPYVTQDRGTVANQTYRILPAHKQEALEIAVRSAAEVYIRQDNVQLIMIRSLLREYFRAIYRGCNNREKVIVRSIIDEVIGKANLGNADLILSRERQILRFNVPLPHFVIQDRLRNRGAGRLIIPFDLAGVGGWAAVVFFYFFGEYLGFWQRATVLKWMEDKLEGKRYSEALIKVANWILTPPAFIAEVLRNIIPQKWQFAYTRGFDTTYNGVSPQSSTPARMIIPSHTRTSNQSTGKQFYPDSSMPMSANVYKALASKYIKEKYFAGAVDIFTEAAAWYAEEGAEYAENGFEQNDKEEYIKALSCYDKTIEYYKQILRISETQRINKGQIKNVPLLLSLAHLNKCIVYREMAAIDQEHKRELRDLSKEEFDQSYLSYWDNITLQENNQPGNEKVILRTVWANFANGREFKASEVAEVLRDEFRNYRYMGTDRVRTVLNRLSEYGLLEKKKDGGTSIYCYPWSEDEYGSFRNDPDELDQNNPPIKPSTALMIVSQPDDAPEINLFELDMVYAIEQAI
ncbi:MAG: hypothetical protein ABH952_01605 [Candidatus Omnitrophota bacterium]